MARGDKATFPGGGVPQRQSAGRGGERLAEIPRFFGTWVPGGGGIYGPRKLGHESGGRLGVWLYAFVGHHAVEPDGDRAAGARAQAGRGGRTRPCPSLSRSLFQAGFRRSVGGL